MSNNSMRGRSFAETYAISFSAHAPDDLRGHRPDCPVLQVLPDTGMIVVDEEGVIQGVDGQVFTQLGLSQDICGRRLSEVLPADVWRRAEPPGRPRLGARHVPSIGSRPCSRERLLASFLSGCQLGRIAPRRGARRPGHL